MASSENLLYESTSEPCVVIEIYQISLGSTMFGSVETSLIVGGDYIYYSPHSEALGQITSLLQIKASISLMLYLNFVSIKYKQDTSCLR